MEVYQLKKPESIKRRKRVGCGPSSGQGKTCGRGMNGQLSRSGSGKRPWFEGGQMPLQRRVPKRGFNNIFKKDIQVVNISQLDKIESNEIDQEVLEKNHIIKKKTKLVKILGKGDLNKPVKIIADAFSKTAIEKIKKAGGEAVVQKFTAKKDD